MTDVTTEVLVIGGGPAGAATGYWLASQGHSVTIVEKRRFPRDKTCGGGLTPRAVTQMIDMGLADSLSRFHRIDGVRLTGFERQREIHWPAHPTFGNVGYTVRRAELDQVVAEHAVGAGANLIEGAEALHPIVERGFVRGAVVQLGDGHQQELRAKYVVIADGANSRFGRSLGTFRSRDWPYATAIRGFWSSDRADEPWMESSLDLADRDGQAMPGFGWVFPLGDGTVNIGVGLLSTFRDFKNVNTSHLLDEYAHRIAERWGIHPDLPEDKPASGRVPMGGSIGPKSGPTYLVVGDAAGSINPFNGDGIDYAYETGRIAADVLHSALTDSDPTALQQYSRTLDDRYGQYFKVARLFARAIGRPTVMRQFTHIGLRSNTLMELMLRIMTNSLRTQDRGPAEMLYSAAAQLAHLAPNS